jgi:hypothetical protein
VACRRFKTGFLATLIVLCVDAPTIIKTNKAVELNGTKGIIREVVPDPEDTLGWSRITSTSSPRVLVVVTVYFR